MRIQWLRGIAVRLGLLGAVAVRLGLLGAVALTLVSCGGGGVSSETNVQLGTLTINPNTGTLYAGVPFTVTISGGTRPYRVTSNEQTVLPLPPNYTVQGGSFTLIPNNPGVVDPQTDPLAVPSRSVNLTVIDATGLPATVTYKVLQNFAFGYNVNLSSISTCGATVAAGTTNPAACAGFESSVTLTPITDGLLFSNKQETLTALLGDFGMIDGQGNVVPSVTVTTDFHGDASARLFAFPSARTQFAILRVTDVQTGAYRDVNFVLSAAPVSTLVILPTSISLAGTTTLMCGGGSTNVLVTGGRPPYTAVSTNPNAFTVSPPLVTFSGGSFTVNILGGAPPNCPSGSIVVSDSSGQSAPFNITTTAGTVVPPQPLTVFPQGFCLADAQNTSVLVNGGNANKVANSSNTALATVAPATFTGNSTLTVNAVGVGGAVGTLVTISVSDGGPPQNILVTRKTTCP